LSGTQDGILGNRSSTGDFDGDGKGDILLSEDSDRGKVYTVFGANFPIVSTSQQISSAAAYSWHGGSELAMAGSDIAVFGDVDGDGDDDYAISAPGEGDSGAVYVIPGFFSQGGDFDLENPNISLISPNAQGVVRMTGDNGDGLSKLSYEGDYNGDGVNDLLIGAPGNSYSASNGGAVYSVYFGDLGWNSWWDPSTGIPHADIDLSVEATNLNFVARVASNTENEGFGSSVSSVGSANGDSYDDFAVGISSDVGVKYYIFNGGGF